MLNLIEEASRRGYEGDHLVNRVLQALPRRSHPIRPTGFVYAHGFTPMWDRSGRRVNLRPMMVRTLVAERDRRRPPWWYSYFEDSTDASNTLSFSRKTTERYENTIRNVTTPAQLRKLSAIDVVDATPLVRKLCARTIKRNPDVTLSWEDLVQESWVVIYSLREQFVDRATSFAGFAAVGVANRLQELRPIFESETASGDFSN